jgi:pSer/pThr/pTyr-binding forkhead associated (FHA) protein
LSYAGNEEWRSKQSMNSVAALILVIAAVIGMLLHRHRQIQREQNSLSGTATSNPEIKAAEPSPETVRAVPVKGQIRLRLTASDGSIHERLVDQTPYAIGRKSDNLLVLESDTVSRRHAKLVYHPDQERWHIEDVGSTNGLFVNQRRVSREKLRNGDELLIGGYIFTVITERTSRETPVVRLVQGRYSDIMHLRPGGNADVYRAIDTQNGQVVAVKIPRLGSTDDLAALPRFRDEVAWAMPLQHRNIVRVYGEDRLPDGTPCMIMEFLPGGSLRQRMTPGKPLPEDTVRSVGIQIGSALTYLHNQGLVHRDIKPENALFAADGVLRITDLGIAYNSKDARIVVGMQIGTPHYMCPEQIRCEQPTPAFDLYALGCVLYEMGTGVCPFEGAYEEVIEGHRSRSPEAPSLLNERLSSELDRLIMQLLNKNPYRRPQSASEVVSALSSRVPA